MTTPAKGVTELLVLWRQGNPEARERLTPWPESLESCCSSGPAVCCAQRYAHIP